MARENTYANVLLGSNPVAGKGEIVFDVTTGQLLVGDGNTAYRGLIRRAESAERGAVKLSWGNLIGTLSNQTDLQNALNGKQDTLTLTTTGTSGAATLVGSTLNIPVYSSGSGGFGSGEILDLGDRMTGNAVFDVGNRV